MLRKRKTKQSGAKKWFSLQLVFSNIVLISLHNTDSQWQHDNSLSFQVDSDTFGILKPYKNIYLTKLYVESIYFAYKMVEFGYASDLMGR